MSTISRQGITACFFNITKLCKRKLRLKDRRSAGPCDQLGCSFFAGMGSIIVAVKSKRAFS